MEDTNILKRIFNRLDLMFSTNVVTEDANKEEVDIASTTGEIQVGDVVTSGQTGEVVLPTEGETLTVDENGNVIDIAVAPTEVPAETEMAAEPVAPTEVPTEDVATEDVEDSKEDERISMLESKVDEILAMMKEMVKVQMAAAEDLACVKEQPVKEKFAAIEAEKGNTTKEKLAAIQEYLKNK